MASSTSQPKSNRKATASSTESTLLGLPTKITALLNSESDRGIILVVAAYLDELLGLIVRESCISKKDADGLLEYRRPAGDFDSKIRLCTALGLIHSTETKSLRAIQRIRNRSAHFDKKGEGFDVLFDSEQTIAQVRLLAEAQNLGLGGNDKKSVRETFVVASRLLAAKLCIRRIETRRPRPPATLKELANQSRVRLKDTPVGKVIQYAENQARKGNPEILYDLVVKMGEVLRGQLAGSESRKEEEHGGAQKS